MLVKMYDLSHHKLLDLARACLPDAPQGHGLSAICTMQGRIDSETSQGSQQQVASPIFLTSERQQFCSPMLRETFHFIHLWQLNGGDGSGWRSRWYLVMMCFWELKIPHACLILP